MNPDEKLSEAVCEADPRFRSGPWTGYWVQGAPGGIILGWMDLQLRFAAGLLSGTGRDLVGDFSMKGKYHTESGGCFIRKRYSSHEVVYLGSTDGTGIRGRWEIPPHFSGAFSIWPGSAGNRFVAETAAETPVEAVESSCTPALVHLPTD